MSLLTCLMLITVAGTPQSPADSDATAIRRAALDYIEGWYTGDAERMQRAVHPELAKRMVFLDEQQRRSRLNQQSAMTLVQSTKAGGGRQTPEVRRRQDVTILDIYNNAASVKIVAGDWVDYLHLVRWNGEWKIINVLWERHPSEGDRE